MIIYSRETFFFSSEYLNQKRMSSLQLDLKSTLSLQYGKSLSLVRLNLVFKSNKLNPFKEPSD